MDYYQPTRTHAAAAASAAQNHQQYVQYSSQGPQSGSNSHMYYQQPTLPTQSQQNHYSHFTIQPASANSPLDHGAQHQHNTSSHQYHSATGHGHQQAQQHAAAQAQAQAQQHQAQQHQAQAQHHHQAHQQHHPNTTLQSLQHLQQQQQQQHAHQSRRPTTTGVVPRSVENVVAPPTQDLPLRIVIDSRYVGAIIGSGGANIREITKESRARVVVDVQRTMKDAHGNTEKIISIIGSLECCSKACVKIMEVVHRELGKDENKLNNEVELKIRAHNQLVGRLIGKQGATIKKIMNETSTNISVSNEQNNRSAEFPPFGAPYGDVFLQLERTITIKGASIENVSSAEQKVSAKLRQSYELDLQNRISLQGIQGNPMMPGIMGPVADPYALLHNQPRMPSMSQQIKTTRMWVPNNMVGAIIGSKGANIRNIMRNSGANIRIDGGDKKKEDAKKPGEESQNSDSKDEHHHLLDDSTAGDSSTFSAEKSSDEEKGQPGSPGGIEKKEDDRLITITGSDIQQYRAQFWIFTRVAEQDQKGIEEIKLRTEVTVPSRVVGRIIGKGGQNVRELQRITGASVNVKIPDEDRNAGASADHSAREDEENTTVRIVGTVQASQNVQMRLGQLINEFQRANIHDGRKRHEGRKNSPPSNHSD
ncbi:unnamed protein product [Caenorhabditis auriculariae]|uniref:K Homology domain-containing protein n=1 Tax=Caenorhabditis auriculariae TaxID=2777116 RepID=A0A8S1GT32_9PELO|nr:unnamed protein product [Caenorhabditis auriculariae]